MENKAEPFVERRKSPWREIVEVLLQAMADAEADEASQSQDTRDAVSSSGTRR